MYQTKKKLTSILEDGFLLFSHIKIKYNHHKLISFVINFLMVIKYLRTFSIITSYPYTKVSLKERQAQPHKRTHRFILGNPHGEEKPAKLPQYRIQPNIM